MTTRVDLVRHGQHPLLGRVLCGRMPGVGLDPVGRTQIADCAERLLDCPIDVVQSSPQLRAVQSAGIIAANCSATVELIAELDEIDMGDWTGMRIAALEPDPQWRAWNERRGTECPPNGESAVSLQRRVVGHLERIRKEDPEIRYVIVSHAEPIRVALMYYLGIPLDSFQSVEVGPASISSLLLRRSRAVVAQVSGKAVA